MPSAQQHEIRDLGSATLPHREDVMDVAPARRPGAIGPDAVLVSSLLLIDICQEWPGVIPSWAQRPTVAGLVFGAAMVVWLSLGGVDADVPFIYFQF